MVLLLKIISDVFLKKPLMLKLKMTGENFSLGILKLLHIRFMENGFKLWYNYVNVNSICGYEVLGTFDDGIEEQHVFDLYGNPEQLEKVVLTTKAER